MPKYYTGLFVINLISIYTLGIYTGQLKNRPRNKFLTDVSIYQRYMTSQTAEF